MDGSIRFCLELRYNASGDMGRGEWVSTLFRVGDAANFVAARGKGKTFDVALVAVAVKLTGWGKSGITYDGPTELPRLGTIMQAHKDWTLAVEPADDGRWTATFRRGEAVLSSLTHDRAYEAVVRAFDVALPSGGGAWWGDVALPPTDL